MDKLINSTTLRQSKSIYQLAQKLLNHVTDSLHHVPCIYISAQKRNVFF